MGSAKETERNAPDTEVDKMIDKGPRRVEVSDHSESDANKESGNRNEESGDVVERARPSSPSSRLVSFQAWRDDVDTWMAKSDAWREKTVQHFIPMPSCIVKMPYASIIDKVWLLVNMDEIKKRKLLSMFGGAICVSPDGLLITTFVAVAPNKFHKNFKNYKVKGRGYTSEFRSVVFVDELRSHGLLLYKANKLADERDFPYFNLDTIGELGPLPLASTVFSFTHEGAPFAFVDGYNSLEVPQYRLFRDMRKPSRPVIIDGENLINLNLPFLQFSGLGTFTYEGQSGCPVFRSDDQQFVGLIAFTLGMFNMVIPLCIIKEMYTSSKKDGRKRKRENEGGGGGGGEGDRGGKRKEWQGGKGHGERGAKHKRGRGGRGRGRGRSSGQSSRMRGYSCNQFGMQILLESMRVDEPEHPNETPEEVVSNFTSPLFDSPQGVSKGARHMAADEINAKPRVENRLPSIYFDSVMVSTCSTTDGDTVIEAFYQFAGVKWLCNKASNKFEDAQWLLFQKAVEKLLQVTVKLPEKVPNKLVNDAQEMYLSCGVSRSAQTWNEQRKLILEDAIFNSILPALEKEVRLLSTRRAEKRLLMDYVKRLLDKVFVALYQQKHSEMSSDGEVAPRIMACCWGPGKPSTTFVMLDSFREIVDVLEGGLIRLEFQNVAVKQRKKQEQKKLLGFMTEHQPEVVVVGAVNLSCSRPKDEIVFWMVEENPRDVAHDIAGLGVCYEDESWPCLYKNSQISTEQIPCQRGIVKRAVVLGRHFQIPFDMVASLCDPDQDVLSWKLNLLKSFLNADDKYWMVEQILGDITSQVGTSLSLAAYKEWLFTSLQFISGLGQRKAACLQLSLVRAGVIVTREDLLTSHGLGRKVSGLVVSTNQFVDVMDDTRIHLESYALAHEMAKDIYRAVIFDDNLDDDAAEMAIDLRDSSCALNSFSVDYCAVNRDCVSEIETLHAVKLELLQRFQGCHRKFEELKQDEEFYLISVENDDTLCEGRIVQATVRRVQLHRAIWSMESGLSGMLRREEHSDDWRADLTEKLLSFKVQSILRKRYQVFCTWRKKDMKNIGHQNAEILDPYYHEDKSSLQSEQERVWKEKELALKDFIPRMIAHRCFQNITDEAMKFLAYKDSGESIIRPSSHAPSVLTLTPEFYEGVFPQKDLNEDRKDRKEITSLLRIRKRLRTGVDIFEVLDEVIDRAAKRKKNR